MAQGYPNPNPNPPPYGDLPRGPPLGARRPWGEHDKLKRRAAWEREVDSEPCKRVRLDDQGRLAFMVGVDDGALHPVWHVVELLSVVFSYLDTAHRGRTRRTNWTLMRVGGYDACWAEGVDIENVLNLPSNTPKMTLRAYRLADSLGLSPSLGDRLDYLKYERKRCEATLRRKDAARAKDEDERVERIDDIKRATDLLCSGPNITQTRRYRRRMSWALRCIERLQVRSLRREVCYLWWVDRLGGLQNAIAIVRLKLLRVRTFRAFPPMRSAWAFYTMSWDSRDPSERGWRGRLQPAQNVCQDSDACFFLRPGDLPGVDDELFGGGGNNADILACDEVLEAI